MKKSVNCGGIIIGGMSPISIQSMLNVDTRDVKSAVRQIKSLEEIGCDIVRLAIPDMESATALKEIRSKTKMPLVADIHFDYKLAIESIKNGADKIRINPGNIGDREKVRKVVEKAKEKNIPIRIGVNSGSLEKDILERDGGVKAEGLAESALRNVDILEGMGFENVVISLKASDVRLNYEAYKIIDKKTGYPLHIGVTEAGTVNSGKIKSAVGIGALLLSGIGNTLRVSLTGKPEEEIVVAKEILNAAGLRENGINIISCPTCGRTKVNLEKIVKNIEEEIIPLKVLWEKEKRKAITIAVMGCEVNGPGEAKEADIGVASGKGVGAIFKKGKIIEVVEEKDIVKELMRMVKTL